MLAVELNRLPNLQILESSEEPVPMAGNAYVSGFIGCCGTRNVADCAIQRQVVRTFQYRYLKLERRNLENSYWWRNVGEKACLVGFNALFGPKAEIRRSIR